jgi:hypothetical protein
MRRFSLKFHLQEATTLAHHPAHHRAITKLPKLNRPHIELQDITSQLLDQETTPEDLYCKLVPRPKDEQVAPTSRAILHRAPLLERHPR